jgi:hypothetical protein
MQRLFGRGSKFHVKDSRLLRLLLRLMYMPPFCFASSCTLLFSQFFFVTLDQVCPLARKLNR